MVEQTDLEVLACDMAARPKGAPGFPDIAPSIRSVKRVPGELMIEFDPAMASAVTELVEAERLCCAGLLWNLQTDSGLVLRIGGTEPQLDVLASLTSS